MVRRFDVDSDPQDGPCSLWEVEQDDGPYVSHKDYAELESENQKLREQRDAANAVIQTLNRIIAGDVE